MQARGPAALVAGLRPLRRRAIPSAPVPSVPVPSAALPVGGPAYARPVLRIRRSIVEAIVAHARRDHPDEACGVVAGPAGSDSPERVVPMLNAARSPTFYEFDPAEQLALYREMDERDEEPIVVYHSHTATEAYPSRTDVALATEPGAHYVLVATGEGADTEQVRSYRIVDGTVSEEEVVQLDG